MLARKYFTATIKPPKINHKMFPSIFISYMFVSIAKLTIFINNTNILLIKKYAQMLSSM
jgi:hypothetical protein